MQSPAASITLGNAGMVGPSSCQKYAPVGSRRVVADAGRGRRKTGYRNSNSLFRSRLQVASRCRQSFEYRPSGHPVKRHRELQQLLGNFAHAHCRRKTREKLSNALCGQARRRSAKALRELAHSQCRSYDKSYVERIMRCLRSLSYLSNQPGYLGSAEKKEAPAGHNQWPLVCFSHH
jgi:hypothetical protein